MSTPGQRVRQASLCFSRDLKSDSVLQAQRLPLLIDSDADATRGRNPSGGYIDQAVAQYDTTTTVTVGG